MSVNVYNKDTGELKPLTSAFSTLAIVDVADLPSSNILDVIYRVTAETYGFHSVTLYDNDMETNTSNLEAIGFSTSTSGDNYIYTPSTKKIRYLNGDSIDYDVKYVVINSVDKNIQVYNTADNLLLDATIASGAGYPFYNANYWSENTVTLSDSDMDANTAALVALGFTSTTDNTTWEYLPNDMRFRYDENTAANELTRITISAGEMTVYKESTVIDTVAQALA